MVTLAIDFCLYNKIIWQNGQIIEVIMAFVNMRA